MENGEPKALWMARLKKNQGRRRLGEGSKGTNCYLGWGTKKMKKNYAKRGGIKQPRKASEKEGKS